MTSNIINYTVAIIVLYTPDEEEVKLRFLIFEDGTVFEFYGNYGSLRSHMIISADIAQHYIYNCKQFNYSDKSINYELFHHLKNGIISQYINMYRPEYINSNLSNIIYQCLVLKDDLGDIFVSRMLNTQMIYINNNSTELFNKYKNIIISNHVNDISK